MARQLNLSCAGEQVARANRASPKMPGVTERTQLPAKLTQRKAISAHPESFVHDQLQSPVTAPLPLLVFGRSGRGSGLATCCLAAKSPRVPRLLMVDLWAPRCFLPRRTQPSPQTDTVVRSAPD